MQQLPPPSRQRKGGAMRGGVVIASVIFLIWVGVGNTVFGVKEKGEIAAGI
jgi:hypothetical protein